MSNAGKEIIFHLPFDVDTSTLVEYAARLIIASGHHHENVAKGMHEYLQEQGFFDETDPD
jgi:hypothetical protein